MTIHKFAIGDRVEFIPTSADPTVRRGVYTIVRTLPEAGRGLQYRVKHAEDSHERVLSEAQLRPINR